MLTFKSKGIQIFAPLNEISFLNRELRLMIPEALTIIYKTPEYVKIIRPQLPNSEAILDKYNPWYLSMDCRLLFTDLVWILKSYAPKNYDFIKSNCFGHWGYYQARHIENHRLYPWQQNLKHREKIYNAYKQTRV